MIVVMQFAVLFCQVDSRPQIEKFGAFRERFLLDFENLPGKKPLLANYFLIPNDSRYLRILSSKVGIAEFGIEDRQLASLKSRITELSSMGEAPLADSRSKISSRMFKDFRIEQRRKITSFLLTQEGLVALRHPSIRDVLAIDSETQDLIRDELIKFEKEVLVVKASFWSRNIDDLKVENLVNSCIENEKHLWATTLTSEYRAAILALPTIKKEQIHALRDSVATKG